MRCFEYNGYDILGEVCLFFLKNIKEISYVKVRLKIRSKIRVRVYRLIFNFN